MYKGKPPQVFLVYYFQFHSYEDILTPNIYAILGIACNAN